MVFTSLSKAPANKRLTQSTMACCRLSSVAPATRSAICCGESTSGPPAEPRGNERKALTTSSLLTCKGSKRGLPAGSQGNRLSAAGGGCFDLSYYYYYHNYLLGNSSDAAFAVSTAATRLQLHACVRCRSWNLLWRFSTISLRPCSLLRQRSKPSHWESFVTSPTGISRLSVSCHFRRIHVHGAKWRHRVYDHDTIAFLWV